MATIPASNPPSICSQAQSLPRLFPSLSSQAPQKSCLHSWSRTSSLLARSAPCCLDSTLPIPWKLFCSDHFTAKLKGHVTSQFSMVWTSQHCKTNWQLPPQASLSFQRSSPSFLTVPCLSPSLAFLLLSFRCLPFPSIRGGGSSWHCPQFPSLKILSLTCLLLQSH